MIRFLEEARCPICALAQEALAVYLAWYEAGIPGWLAPSRRRGDGLGRLCRDHLWTLARDADPAILLDLSVLMLEDDRLRLKCPEAILAAPDPLPPWRSGTPKRWWPQATASWLKAMYRREARRAAQAKWEICRPRECFACKHLDTITRRSLELLFVVLQDPVMRVRYQAAWGLCVQHFADGITRPVEPVVLEAVVDVQIARLATLEWELEEFYRKAAWDVRYEPKGPEQTAWARAIERFSGTDLQIAAQPDA